jgi:hypothetical protein
MLKLVKVESGSEQVVCRPYVVRLKIFTIFEKNT